MTTKNVVALSLVAFSTFAAGCAVAPEDASSSTPATGTDDENVGSTSAEITVQGNQWLLPYHGGQGGTPSEISCGAGEIATGLFGSYSTHPYFPFSVRVIDNVGLICSTLHASGALVNVRTVGPAGSPVNGQNAQAFYLQCPAGQAITTLRGRSATFLDAIGASCSPAPFTSRPGTPAGLTPEQQLALMQGNASILASTTGGTGGQEFSDACLAGQWALQKLSVRSGSWVDGVRGSCVALQGALTPGMTVPVRPR